MEPTVQRAPRHRRLATGDSRCARALLTVPLAMWIGACTGDDGAQDAGAPALASKTEDLRQKWVKSELVKAGRSRAASVGWPDEVYATTKSIRSQRRSPNPRNDDRPLVAFSGSAALEIRSIEAGARANRDAPPFWLEGRRQVPMIEGV